MGAGAWPSDRGLVFGLRISDSCQTAVGSSGRIRYACMVLHDVRMKETETMAIHEQAICTTLIGEQIEVDELLAPYIQRLWDAGITTWTSCQWDGPKDKKYPAYINPNVPNEPRPATPEEMAKVLGLEQGQWRQYNGVLWLHRSLVQHKPGKILYRPKGAQRPSTMDTVRWKRIQSKNDDVDTYVAIACEAGKTPND